MEAQIYSKSNPFDNLRVSFEELVPDTYPNKKEGAEWTTEPYNWTSMLFYRCRMLYIEEKEKKDEDEKKETKEAKKNLKDNERFIFLVLLAPVGPFPLCASC